MLEILQELHPLTKVAFLGGMAILWFVGGMLLHLKDLE